MNIIDDVLLLPHRARWHLTRWENLTRRERRRLRRHPTLLYQQRAWVAASPARMNRLMKRIYSQPLREMPPPTMMFTRFFPTSK